MTASKKINVSLIIVVYKNSKILEKLLRSVPKNEGVETIVIDNSVTNRGFGAACNLGAKRAKGEYLFFVNPDCVLNKHTIPTLLKKLKSDTKIGVIGPQLRDDNNTAYLSTTRQPTIWSAPVVYSALNRIPNVLSARHWYKNHELNSEKLVGSISGAAMMMRKNLFEKLGGFDEAFFLYWEDNDICRRVSEEGYRILYYPKAYVIHSRGKSTDRENGEIIRAFKASRYRFFRKHFGKLYATLLETWLALFEEWKLLFIIGLAAFLRFDRITTLMPLIGDQGRDFLAAVEAWETGQLPLLGIRSSIPRFQQGPLYIWLLTAVFGLFGPEAEWAGIMSALIGLLAVIGTYFLAQEQLSKKTALLAALILAASPLVVVQSRLAFMTNPIPLFSVLFLWVLQKKADSVKTFGWIALSWALLFQFELAAAPLLLLLIFYWIKYYYADKGKRMLSLRWAFTGLAVGLAPQIIFDVTNNFKQLGMFLLWIGYRLISFVGFDAEHQFSISKLATYWSSLHNYLGKYWVWQSDWGIYASLAIILFGTFKYIRTFENYKKVTLIGWSLLWLWVQLTAYLIHGSPSEAYFPGLFVPLAIVTGWIFMSLPRRLTGLAVVVILAWSIHSTTALFHNDYYVATEKNWNKDWQTYGLPLAYQKEIVSVIHDHIGNQPVTYKSLGVGSQFSSYMDGYTFLSLSQGFEVDTDNGLPVYIYSPIGEASVKDYWHYQLYGQVIALPKVYENKD